MKKLLTLTLGVLSLLVFAGCDRGGTLPGGEQIQKDKTQLYVSNFDGGIGTEWLYKMKKIYEEEHSEDVYEEGKKGVQILVDPHKNNGYHMINTFDGSTIDISFNQNIRYNDWVAKDLFLDITDVVTEINEGSSVTIEERLDPAQKAFLQKNGKYYAIPHYAGYQSLIYNIDLFEKKGFYFSQEVDNGNDGFVVKGEQKSCGPDGIYGTIDDGLPSSHEEFFKLCDYMVSRGVIPFVWTCQYAIDYYQGLMNAVYQAYEGKEDVMLNYTYDSGDNTTEIIKNIINGQLITEDVKITPENGYLLKQQTGRYYAIEFFSKVVSNSSYYHPYSTGNLTFSHTDAQETYFESDLKNEPIAFLLDGPWWENEAKLSGAIDRSINKYGAEKASNRNFGYLPLPSKISGRVEEGQGSVSVLQDSINSFAGINKDIPSYKVELAKDFLRFCYTDEMLELFTVTTGIPKSLNYSISEQKMKEMTGFARSTWEMKEASEIIYPYSDSEFFNKNQTNLTVGEWESTVNGSYENMYYHFKNKKSPVDIFLGNFITQDKWLSKYFK